MGKKQELTSIRKLEKLILDLEGYASKAIINVHNLCFHEIPMKEITHSNQGDLATTWEIAEFIFAIEKRQKLNQDTSEISNALTDWIRDNDSATDALTHVHNMPLHMMYDLSNISEDDQYHIEILWDIRNRIEAIELEVAPNQPKTILLESCRKIAV
ncbi:MAG: hypothetical protein JXR61_03180 [Prolixibacteraceae bacterium]|nr:hypothetical protein [Prolixibacteraceae bacterium]